MQWPADVFSVLSDKCSAEGALGTMRLWIRFLICIYTTRNRRYSHLWSEVMYLSLRIIKQ